MQRTPNALYSRMRYLYPGFTGLGGLRRDEQWLVDVRAYFKEHPDRDWLGVVKANYDHLGRVLDLA